MYLVIETTQSWFGLNGAVGFAFLDLYGLNRHCRLPSTMIIKHKLGPIAFLFLLFQKNSCHTCVSSAIEFTEFHKINWGGSYMSNIPMPALLNFSWDILFFQVSSSSHVIRQMSSLPLPSLQKLPSSCCSHSLLHFQKHKYFSHFISVTTLPFTPNLSTGPKAPAFTTNEFIKPANVGLFLWRICMSTA